ncbi:PLP-dependent aminotransferase family protein [Pseudoalteromonas sp. NEC-BIFX-2020_015]|uniref:MocR-like pyridoxine biosynthesis transcription factor PdxR n=1 Tax=Pseudoalteromonas sp. NEC-BIFX-2020_015 TaxID=2729544 RepID=UPI00146131B0|nr:PLP-dependent aminotransferase family protein [Pseudoalteromonas sp. NEC-BIFX-2020_015]NMR24286.1 PLP-dependent aminotransferase family protein [Pseudoalteromonas sp. NEC-BIFX-2020_015]
MQPLDIQFHESQPAKYLQLASALRSAIMQGKFAPGVKLSSARAMANTYQLNRHTVMNALQLLVAEGWLISNERSGYRVTDSLPIQSSIGVKTAPALQSTPYQFANTLEVPSVGMDLNAYKYNFAGGLPDLASFPQKEFKRAISHVCDHIDISKLHYGEVSGCAELKVQIKEYLHKTRNLDTDDILICNGSQEALFLIAKAFIAKGDNIAVETLGYPPARKAFAACGAQLVDIKQDDEGLCVDDLKAQLMRFPIKMLYLTPLHQYPTTVTLSPTRRLQIYQLCYSHNVMIIEDDYDHEFHYRCQPLQPMAADDPAGIIIYVSTFSKIMFSAARIGYICAAPEVIAQLTAWKQLMNHKNDVIMQLAVAHWMKEGGFERHLKRMTKLYKQRYEAMDSYLMQLQAQGYPIEYIKPDGGMAIWVNFNKNTRDLKTELAKQCVYIQTEREFYFANSVRSLKPANLSYIRLGFAGQSNESMQLGLSLIIQQTYKR